MTKRIISILTVAVLLCGMFSNVTFADPVVVIIGHDKTSPLTDVVEYTDSGYSDSGTAGYNGGTRANSGSANVAVVPTNGSPIPTTNYAKWRPIPNTTANWGAGLWRVSFYNAQRATPSGAATDVKVVTYHNDTLEPLTTVNQQLSSGWVSLGDFNFAGDGREFVMLYRPSGALYATADTIKFEKIGEYTPPSKLIIEHDTTAVDNPEYADITSSAPVTSWSNSGVIGYMGGLSDTSGNNSRSTNTEANVLTGTLPNRYAKWQPLVTNSQWGVGTYRVSVWNTIRPTDGSQNVQAYVFHNGIKETPVGINQKTSANGWVDIGSYAFTGDGSEYVAMYKTDASSATIVTADSVKFERVYPSALTGLSISTGTLSPAFSAAQTSYTSDVYASSINVTATGVGTITINSLPATSGVPSTVSLVDGTNTIAVNVAEVGKTTATYNIVVTKHGVWSDGASTIIQHTKGSNVVAEYSENPAWADSGIAGYPGETVVGTRIIGIAADSFVSGKPNRYAMWKPITGTTPNWGNGTYKVEIYNAIRPALDGIDEAIVQVNHNGTLEQFSINQKSGSSRWEDLGRLVFSGDGTEYVLIYKPTTTTGTYVTADSVRVTKQINSGESKLDVLSIAGASISPAFLSTTYAYSALVNASSMNLNITPINLSSTMKINGVAANTGANTKPLTIGTNVFEIVVTPPNGSASTYTLTVERQVRLSDLNITDDNGSNVTSLTTVPTVSPATIPRVHFNVALDNCTASTTATLIFALYDGDTLVDVDVKTLITGVAGNKSLEGILMLPAIIKPTHNVKAFLWKGVNDIMPYGNAKSL